MLKLFKSKKFPSVWSADKHRVANSLTLFNCVWWLLGHANFYNCVVCTLDINGADARIVAIDVGYFVELGFSQSGHAALFSASVLMKTGPSFPSRRVKKRLETVDVRETGRTTPTACLTAAVVVVGELLVGWCVGCVIWLVICLLGCLLGCLLVWCQSRANCSSFGLVAPWLFV